MKGLTTYAMLAALGSLGPSAFTATPPRMEPVQNGRRAFKNAEVLRKAQEKRDRKAAKRLGK
jgi:hypothetical protein